MKGAEFGPIQLPITCLRLLMPNLKQQLSSKYYNGF